MWSDRESEHDCLGFASYVDVLADVCTLPDLAPLTLGIFGSWGSGKTSLMRMLKSRIEAQKERCVKTLWFNAWRYERREEAQSALIHAILARLAEDKNLWDQASDVVNRIKEGASVLKLAKFIGKTAMTMTPDISEFVDCFKEESERVAETMEVFDRDFELLLKKMQVEHVVVFIDDLDRCSSEKVIETFETIKLFLNTPACTFVIGADAEKIEDAVGEIYSVSESQRRKDFLEKIIQVPFSIPAQELRDIACYVGMLIIGRNLNDAGLADLLAARTAFLAAEQIGDSIRTWPDENQLHLKHKPEQVQSELDDVLPYVDVLAHGLRGNPRQIKRFLNIVSLRQKLANANSLEIQPALLIKLAVLEYAWEDFFNAIVDTIDPQTGTSALIQEMFAIADSEGQKQSNSELVTESLGHVGLLDFLRAEPPLDGNDNLSHYLYLAQTSLGQGKRQALVPVDEKAKSLSRLIASNDPIRTKTAARQAAAQEPAVVSAIIRALLADLPAVNQMTIQIHMINGLSEICRSHADQFPVVIKGLSSLDPKGQDAINVAVSSLLTAAEGAGHTVDEKTRGRFQSKLAEALTVRKKKKKDRV
ncbi:KAP family P-loop domain protein [Crateriforma conspicua]|nr:KAP family P-loop domain protein [Crateriforma conspicua]